MPSPIGTVCDAIRDPVTGHDGGGERTELTEYSAMGDLDCHT